MKSLLEHVTRDITRQENIQFSDLYSRLFFVCKKHGFSKRQSFGVQLLRVRMKNISEQSNTISELEYLADIKTLCNFISRIYDAEIPQSLRLILPDKDIESIPQLPRGKTIAKVSMIVESWDDTFIYGYDDNNPSIEPLRVQYHSNNASQFKSVGALLWENCRLNLLNCRINETTYLPELIILEPDYLIDISALAECVKDYGSHPLFYMMNKFKATDNTKHILLGNAANLFLDEFVNEQAERPVDYAEVMRKFFRMYPLELATCMNLDEEFFQLSKIQFNNIRQIVSVLFPQYEINRNKAILEPSFICEALGIQGRLDLLMIESGGRMESESGRGAIIVELKSGKAPYPEHNYSLISPNHKAQGYLYNILIRYVFGLSYETLKTYILYSRYEDLKANLRFTQPYMAAVIEIMNIRNHIVAAEWQIARDPAKLRISASYISQVNPDTLITKPGVSNKFISQYIIPQIELFGDIFDNLSHLESAYFHSFHSFIAKEQFYAKTGNVTHESGRGFSSLWRSSLYDKTEEGEIMYNLTISELNASDDIPLIRFKVSREDDLPPNFREGDMIVLYERNCNSDNVTNRQIFKGAIVELSSDALLIRLRFRQRNTSIFPLYKRYAIEHDYMDHSFQTMFRGIYAFLHANTDRRDLILCKRKPEFDSSVSIAGNYGDIINRMILKAKQAKDYFIVTGPPGTGKTSLALKSMVEEFYSEPSNNILLLAYTNRAVDEICDALDTIAGQPPYLRCGMEFSCKESHRDKLLDKVIACCKNRNELKNKIGEYRIFTGTIASISGKMELFGLKRFNVAIVDEASQILEPQIVGILSAKDAMGNNAVDRFILIGDHKQLPAIVLQPAKDSKTDNPELLNIGLADLRMSLFERLYRMNILCENHDVLFMLNKQGRMHPEISAFPNTFFYRNQLEPVPLSHQESLLEFVQYDANSSWEKLVATQRLAFVVAEKDHGISNKRNIREAEIAVHIVESLYNLYLKNGLAFNHNKSIGIITPYRSQIACIKNEIRQLNIPVLNRISVDTVERYQGSQRDMIIYSFCINEHYQMEFISNMIEDDGMIIDRKLNVAVTRARKQLFLTGNPVILSDNIIFNRLLYWIRKHGSFIGT